MIITRQATPEYFDGWNRIFGPDHKIITTEKKKGHDYYPMRPIPYVPVTRPGTPEYRAGYDLIFNKFVDDVSSAAAEDMRQEAYEQLFPRRR